MPPDERGGAKSGQVVVVEIVEQPSPQREAIARVVEVLGSYTDPGMEIEIALRKHDLPHEFSAAAERQAERLPKEVRAADRKGRADLTGAAARHHRRRDREGLRRRRLLRARGPGFRLIVAIADVSHYVRDGDALDRDARERGTSVYFPRRVIPMLPEALSNELCSLKPQSTACAWSATWRSTPTAAIRSYKFYPAVMHSRARLTYTQVWDGSVGEGREAAARDARRCCPSSRTSTRSITR